MGRAVKNVRREWWAALAGLMLGMAGAWVLVPSGVEAAPVTVGGSCAPNRVCRAVYFQPSAPGSVGLVLPSAAFINFYGLPSTTVGIRGTGQGIVVEGTNLQMGGSTMIGWGAYGNATLFPAITSARGIATDLGSLRPWWSDGVSRRGDLASGPHPVLDSALYWYSTDLGTSGAPTWRSGAPRRNGADVGFTTAGTLAVGGGESTYATAAVLGSQAHLSTGVFQGRGGMRWSGRVYPAFALGNYRFFAGMSDALPLAAGSNTPTASAAVFRFVSSVSPNWFACTASAAALTCVDTTVAAQDGVFVTLAIDCREAAACTFWVNGRATNRITTPLPVGNLQLGSTASVETLDANAKLFGFQRVAIESP